MELYKLENKPTNDTIFPYLLNAENIVELEDINT